MGIETLSLPDQLRGQVLSGRYRLLDTIGASATGTVLRGEHVRTGHPVAVKILDPRLITHTRSLARFETEIELLARLNHSHIVQILDHDRTRDGLAFLVMELLEGVTLDQRLTERGPLPLWYAMDLAQQLGSALSEAHDHGILHGDLRATNISLVGDRGSEPVAKVRNFALAGLAGEARPASEGGRALDLPPELIDAPPVVGDQASDQYALAAILFQMLTGSRPFRGKIGAERLYEPDQAPPSLRALAPALPEPLARVLARALAPQCSERYQSVFAFAVALRSVAKSSLPPRSRPSVELPRDAGLPPPAQRKTPKSFIRSARAPSLKAPGRVTTAALPRTDPKATVAQALERARRAVREGQMGEASALIVGACDLARASRDPDAMEQLEAAASLVTQVLIHRLGSLQHRVQLCDPNGGGECLDSFFISRLADGTTIEEALQASPLPRLATLRLLVDLQQRGAIMLTSQSGGLSQAG